MALGSRAKLQVAKREQTFQEQKANKSETTTCQKSGQVAGVEPYGNIEGCGLAP